jgi:hypothetical protein
MKHVNVELSTPRVKLAGRVERIQVLERGIIVAEYDGFDNLVLDSGLNLAASFAFADLFAYCAVGTGNAVPAVNQNSLVAEAARTGSYVTGPGNCGTTIVSPHVFAFKRTWDFPIGSLAGNYTELGFSPDATANGTLFSRVLIKVGGVTSAITVTAAQQLRVVYTLTLTFGPSVDTAFSVNFGGAWGVQTGLSKIQAIYDGVKKVGTNGGSGGYPVFEGTTDVSGFIAKTAGPLAPVGSIAAYTGRDDLLGTAAAYVSGSFSRDKSFSFGTSGAVGSVAAFGLGSSSQFFNYGEICFAAHLDNPQVKLNTNTLTLNFRTSWGR